MSGGQIGRSWQYCFPACIPADTVACIALMLFSMNASALECCAGHWQAYLDPRLYCWRLHVYIGTTIQQGHVSGVVLCVQYLHMLCNHA